MSSPIYFDDRLREHDMTFAYPPCALYVKCPLRSSSPFNIEEVLAEFIAGYSFDLLPKQCIPFYLR